MPPKSPDFDELVKRFEQLRRADRQAVLGMLDAAEQTRILAVLGQDSAVRKSEVEAARRAGRQYAAYSPWLTEIVRQASSEGPAPPALTDKTRRSVTQVHAKLQQDRGDEPGPFGEVLRWFASILDPQGVRQ